jgi:hypothetical protein
VDLASNHGDRPDNLIWLLSVRTDGPVVSQLGDTLLCEEPRQQDVGVWQVKLAYPPVVELWLNLKAATPVIIQQGCKHCGGIEIWVAEKIDRTVHAHKRNRAHVADHAVVFNWLEAHGQISRPL